MNKEQKYTLLVAITTAFLTTFMGSALNLSIPGIEEHFGVSAASVGWVVTAYILAVSAFNVPMGKIADTKGRRLVLLLGLAIFTVGSLGAAFSVSIAMLIILRMIQGLGAAMLFATNNAVLLAAFPEEKHGTALGMSVASTYTGLSLGPVIGGVLNKQFGWQSVFATAVIIGVIAFIVAKVGLTKEEKIQEAKGKDPAGNIIYILMIVCLIYGFTDLSVKSYAWAILAGGLILGVIFVRVELKSSSPVINMRMFRDRTFSFSNVAALLNYGATFAISYLLSIYLQHVKGFDSQTAGLLLIVQPVVMAILSPKTGKMSDKIPAYKMASLGMAICAVCLGALTFLREDTPLAFIVIVQIILGIGFALFSSPNTKAIMERVKAEDYGVANSIVATMRNLGQSYSMAIVTIVVGVIMGSESLHSTDAATLVKVTHIVFLINVILCIGATFLSMMRSKE